MTTVLADEIYERLLAAAQARIREGVPAELVLYETQHLADYYQYQGNVAQVIAADRLCSTLETSYGAAIEAKVAELFSGDFEITVEASPG